VPRLRRVVRAGAQPLRRRLCDTAIAGREVVIDVQVRRFRCVNPACDRKVFAERLPDLAGRYARRTLLAGQLLASVGLAVGGRAGARLAGHLAVATSRATVIRIVRRVPRPDSGHAGGARRG
jgi:hypothetical protein